MESALYEASCLVVEEVMFQGGEWSAGSYEATNVVVGREVAIGSASQGDSRRHGGLL